LESWFSLPVAIIILNTGPSAILAVYGEVKRGNPDLEPKAPQTCVEESPALWAGVLQKERAMNMNDLSDEILTIEEVAAYLKAGRRTVYRFAANGQIPAFKLGGTWRFRRTELDQWIAARIGAQSQPKQNKGKP
jgi:excisionase family DNA binding protein